VADDPKASLGPPAREQVTAPVIEPSDNAWSAQQVGSLDDLSKQIELLSPSIVGPAEFEQVQDRSELN